MNHRPNAAMVKPEPPINIDGLAQEKRLAFGERTITLRHFHLDASGPCFGPFEAMINLWQSKRDGQSLPAWSDFSMRDMRGWHAHLALSVVEPGSKEPRFKIVGEEMKVAHGGRIAGLRFSEYAPEAYAAGFDDYFADIIDKPYIGMGHGQVVVPDQEFIRFHVVELPLGDRDNRSAVVNLLHLYLSTVVL